jgi:hypothetical protein
MKKIQKKYKNAKKLSELSLEFNTDFKKTTSHMYVFRNPPRMDYAKPGIIIVVYSKRIRS